MARDVSIAISAKDNYSSAIATIRNANQGFNKDLTGLQQKMDQLNKTKVALKVDTDKAKTALKEAEKQFAKTGDAADKLKMEMANADYENANRNLRLVSSNAKQAEKDMLSLASSNSKIENRAKSSGGGTSLLSSIAASGAVGLVGNALGDIGTSLISSAYGSEAGTLASSVLSTGAMGAAIGSAIAPGIGTALGALGGSLVGYLQGQSQIFETKDDAFKSYYQDLYNDALSTQSEALSRGIDIASTREVNRIAFSTSLGGDDKADEFLGALTDFAASTPFAYDDLTKISQSLLAYGYKQDEILPLLTKIGDAGSAKGLTTESMEYVATMLGRMRTTGKTTLEYLNPLMDRSIPVFDYLAEAFEKPKDEILELVSKGLIPGEEAAEAIADYMGVDFAGNMEKMSHTYSGLVSTLEDAQAEMDNAMAEGYESIRGEGKKEQTDWLNGEAGEDMKAAYSQIGQWQASLENLQEQYLRDAMNAVMSGTTSEEFSPEIQERLAGMYEEYTQYAADDSEEAGAKMGELLAEAQAIAQNEYNASEGAQLALESNRSLIENIRNDTALKEDYWDLGYEFGLEFSKGREAAAFSTRFASPKQEGEINSYYESKAPARPYAYGLNYVPYDDYPALLHEGERVLTAGENRNYGGNAPIIITGNSFVVRSDDDIRRIGEEVTQQVARQFKQALQLVE